MGDIIKRTTDAAKLPLCFVKIGKQCRLHSNKRGNNLPLIYISEKTRQMLKDFGADYRRVRVKRGYMYEFWDKNLYETEQLSLPIYTCDSHIYEFIGYDTYRAPTKKTIKKACEIQEKIKKYMESQKTEIQVYEGEMEEILRDILKGASARYVYSKSFEEDQEYITQDEHFYVFVLKTNAGELTGHVLIFDKNRLNKYNTTRVKVPKEHIAYICGREGYNVKSWARKMGVSKINLMPKEEKYY